MLICKAASILTDKDSQSAGVSLPAGSTENAQNLVQRKNAALKRLRELQAANPATRLNPDQISWAPPGETIVVNQTQWADFETSLGMVNNQRGPVWYLLEAVTRFKALSISLEATALLIQDALVNRDEPNALPIWDNYIGRFGDLIEPLDNHLFDPDDIASGTNMARQFVQDIGIGVSLDKQETIVGALQKTQLTPGLMNRGGTLDPGNIQQPNLLSTKVTLRRLFDYNADPQGGDNILLNSGPFLQAWELTYKAATALAEFEAEARDMADAFRLQYLPLDANEDEIWHPITEPYPVGRFRRQSIGYDGYWFSKYEGRTRPAGGDEELGERWGESVTNKNLNLAVSNMIASYLDQMDGLIKGLLPMLMNLFADIALKAHAMAAKSSWRSKNWPLLNMPGLDTSLDLLERYPEWSEGRYETG
ncbi:hypothetical protein TWF281_007521 [Arthrobotrys megalospora]